MGIDRKLHPVAFYSQKFPLLRSTTIHDKELLAIVDSFQEWHHFLEGVAHSIAYTWVIRIWSTSCRLGVLNRRQARWNMSLFKFDFVITYRPKKQQGLSNAFLRRSYLAPKAGEAAFDQQCTTLLKPEQFKICAAIILIDANFLN